MQYAGDVACSEGLLWYHGDITRDEARKIIHSYEYRHDGLFLVRYSSASGMYVLSILHQDNSILHYQIKTFNDTFFIESGPKFQSLPDLVEYYRSKVDGLPIRLSAFCKGTLAPREVIKRENTPLHKAASKNDSKGVQKIVDGFPIDVNVRKIHLNFKSLEGYTPLHLAVIKGHVDIVKLLMKLGVNIEVRDDCSNSPLYLAVKHSRLNVVKFLIKNMSPENMAHSDRNSDTGWTVMHEAASRDLNAIVTLLLEAGAPAYPQNFDKDTPADLATQAGYKAIVTLLEKAVSIPKFAIKYRSSQFVHLNIDRKMAAKMLLAPPANDGTFLTRKSQRLKGVHVLSMVYAKKDYHYEINSRNDRFWYIDDGPMWDSLDTLVGYYAQNSDGLVHRLTEPVQVHHKPTKNTQPTQTRSMLPPPQETFQQLKSQASQNVPPPLRQQQRPSAASLIPQDLKKSLMTIPKSALQQVRKLGGGEFGVVLEGVYTKQDGTKLPVAIKTLRKDSILAGTQDFMREAEVMHRLSHPYIVQLIGICEEPSLMLVQELVRYGALLNYLCNKRDSVALSHQMNWGAQIAAGMCYLEGKKFVHRDLAARNILVAAPDMVKISDFGLSRAIKAESEIYQACRGGRWPVKWYAPESTLYGTFSSASDVWSYGVTLWEIFTLGEMPYGDMSGQEVLEMLDQKGERLSKPPHCPDDVYKVMLQCWQYEPTLRPTFRRLHELFDKGNKLYIPDQRKQSAQGFPPPPHLPPPHGGMVYPPGPPRLPGPPPPNMTTGHRP